MLDHPFYNDERFVSYSKQLDFIENSLIPFIEAIKYYLDDTWKTKESTLSLDFDDFYQKRNSKRLQDIKSVLIERAKYKFEKNGLLDESCTISIIQYFNIGTEKMEMNFEFKVFLQEGRFFQIIFMDRSNPLKIIGVQSIGIPVKYIPEVFASVMQDIWEQMLENMPESYAIIEKQNYWFDDERYSAVNSDNTSNLFRKLICEYKEEAVQKVILELKSYNFSLLSGDDSPLINIWEEICVQVQGEESVDWFAYEDTIGNICAGLIEDLPNHQLSLLTHEIELNEGVEEFLSPSGIFPQGVSSFIKEGVLNRAKEYTNRNIERYLYGEDEDEDEEEVEDGNENSEDDIDLNR